LRFQLCDQPSRVNDFVALHVHQDRAEIFPATEGKIIYSKLHYPFYG
jgi:hypothetical protein